MEPPRCPKRASFLARLHNSNKSCNFSRMINLREIHLLTYSIIHSVRLVLHFLVPSPWGVEDSRVRNREESLSLRTFPSNGFSGTVQCKEIPLGAHALDPPRCASWQAFESLSTSLISSCWHHVLLEGCGKAPRVLFFPSFMSKRIEQQFPPLSSQQVSHLIGLEETNSFCLPSLGSGFSLSRSQIHVVGLKRREGVCPQ